MAGRRGRWSLTRVVSAASAVALMGGLVFLASSAVAATQLGSPQGNQQCSPTPSWNEIQQSSAGPSYTVPAAGGTLTSWSVSADAAADKTVQFEVWRPTASPTVFTLVFISTAQPITHGTGVNTFTLSPAVAVNAGDKIGFNQTGGPGDCIQNTQNSGDVFLVNTDPPPSVGSTAPFPTSIPGYEGNVAANFKPPSPPPPTTTTTTPSASAVVVSPRFTG